ncbi:MAG: hypothetical protein INR71_00815 [Terriglobus roseus]|nr:hypothetical protein [Terriglobus roseus]
MGPEAAKIGQGTAFKLKWIKKDGDSLVPVESSPTDAARATLQNIQSTGSLEDAKTLTDLKKRKLVALNKSITYSVRKGPKYAREMVQEVTDLTADMLANGSWQTANFKPYNFNALGGSQNAGALHPLMKVRQEFRQIFFNQGFVEMPTGR